MSALFPISRFGGLSTFDRDADTIFSSFFGPSFPTLFTQRTPRAVSATPQANIAKTDEGYTIDLAAPGFGRDDFNIDVEDNTLTVSAAYEVDNSNDDSVLSQEYSHSSFTRSWILPEGAQCEAIDARYEAGILTVSIPTTNERNNKKLVIDVK